MYIDCILICNKSQFDHSEKNIQLQMYDEQYGYIKKQSGQVESGQY